MPFGPQVDQVLEHGPHLDQVPLVDLDHEVVGPVVGLVLQHLDIALHDELPLGGVHHLDLDSARHVVAIEVLHDDVLPQQEQPLVVLVQLLVDELGVRLREEVGQEHVDACVLNAGPVVAQQLLHVVAHVLEHQQAVVNTDAHVYFVLHLQQVVGLLVDLEAAAHFEGLHDIPAHHV